MWILEGGFGEWVRWGGVGWCGVDVCGGDVVVIQVVCDLSEV